MFKSFTNQNHTLLATSNLQPGSLAGPMLSDYSGAQKQKSILNLLKYGVLSKIQSEGRSDLEKQLKIIINYRDT